MKILVVGSGPSGVHFALTALNRGHQVLMVDVGRSSPPVAMPDKSFNELKSDHEDPVEYFLGRDYGAIVLPAGPGEAKEYYVQPPSKDYALEALKEFSFVSDGLTPLVSFAAGGLAELWTAGAYPLNDEELAAFPFGFSDIAPHYAEVARRIGITGGHDDLSAYFPPHENLSSPRELDESSAILLERYNKNRSRLTDRFKIRMGRSRQCALTQPLGEREACRNCGRCLWGCPNGAFYTPSITLKDCLAKPNFTYVANHFASHFALRPDGPIETLFTRNLASGTDVTWSADAYVLAAGAISSTNILLRSVYKARNEILKLRGLMDNRQMLMPFFNLAMLGRNYKPNSYQYHQLAIGIETEMPDSYVHGQITTLKTATAHPIIRNLPVDMGTATRVFRTLRSGIAVANLNFCDRRRENNYITLSDNEWDEEGWPKLKLRYRPPMGEAEELEKVRKRVSAFFRALGAPAVPGMTTVRHMGTSVHYSGTLPMSSTPASWCVAPNGQSYDIENLYVADGAVMPFLPAKNLTFTLMANAVRMAEAAF